MQWALLELLRFFDRTDRTGDRAFELDLLFKQKRYYRIIGKEGKIGGFMTSVDNSDHIPSPRFTYHIHTHMNHQAMTTSSKWDVPEPEAAVIELHLFASSHCHCAFAVGSGSHPLFFRCWHFEFKFVIHSVIFCEFEQVKNLCCRGLSFWSLKSRHTAHICRGPKKVGGTKKLVDFFFIYSL